MIDTVNNILAMKVDMVVMRHPNPGAAVFLSKHIDAKIINAGDGAHIGVVGNNDAGNAGLGFTQIEKIVLATGQVTNVTNVLGNEALGISNRLVVSPDGTRAAFDGLVSSGVTRLFVIDLGSRVVTALYSSELGTNDSFPCWLGNTSIAFSSDSGGNDSIYKVNLPSSSSASLLVPKAVEPWYGVTSR